MHITPKIANIQSQTITSTRIRSNTVGLTADVPKTLGVNIDIFAVDKAKPAKVLQSIA